MHSADRSGAKHWMNWDLPPHVASVVKDHPGAPWREITWAQVHANRKAKQDRVLEYLRAPDQLSAKPVRILTRYFDQDIYGGWHTYLAHYQHQGGLDDLWIRRNWLMTQKLFLAFPVLPLPADQTARLRFYEDHWEDWQIAFATRYQRGTFSGRPRGCAIAWATYSGSHIAKLTPISRPASRLLRLTFKLTADS